MFLPNRLGKKTHRSTLIMNQREKNSGTVGTVETGGAPTVTVVRGAARLEDIASRVGVSSSEVSRVLNNRVRKGRSVGPAMQEEIWRVARELNYQPHRGAQNLARGKTDTVALMVRLDSTRELSPHYHEIVGALTFTLNEWGLNLLLVQSDEDAAPCLERLAGGRSCDGVIITDMQADDPRPEILTRLGLPFVIRGSAPQPGMIAVGMDNVAVGYKAVEFLRRFGHRRILFHNIGRYLMAGQRRFEGFTKAVCEFGLEETVRYEDEIYKEEDLYDLTRRVLDGPNPPTAIFAADELAAMGVFRALSDMGLSVPDDISVLTCLNARFMRRINPRMSVINVRQEEVAAEAGRTLARVLRGDSVETRQTFLSPILEEHGSCAPPKA